MKYIKSWNIFESFGTSKDYQDFLTSKSISLDLFNDSLFDVKQFASSMTYRYLVDSKGHAVNTDIDENEKYKILYQTRIEYRVKNGKNDISKIIDKLNTIKISIEEMVDRAEAEGLVLDKNVYETSTSDTESVHLFGIFFTGEEIDISELKDSFEEYKKFQDIEYLSGLKRLRHVYNMEGINFDRYMDTTDAEEIILVGVFVDEELYVVGTYNRETKIFSFNEDEINNSIEAINT